MSTFGYLMNDDITVHFRSRNPSPTGGFEFEKRTVKGRLIWKRRKILNEKGEEALSEATLYTSEMLKAGDQVEFDGFRWAIKSVIHRKGVFGGSVDHYEARL